MSEQSKLKYKLRKSKHIIVAISMTNVIIFHKVVTQIQLEKVLIWMDRVTDGQMEGWTDGLPRIQ